jgi:hypothetical protein
LAYQPLAMIAQMPDLQGSVIELRGREHVQALSQRSPRDRQRVDRVGLPRLSRASPGTRHQLRRDPDDSLAPRQQKPLQATGHVPTVLDRPHPLGAEITRPCENRVLPGTSRLDRARLDRRTGPRTDRRARMRALVRVHPNHDH